MTTAPGKGSANKARKLEGLLQKAKRLARERERGQEAIEVNTQILKLDPEQAGSYTRRGACHLAAGDLDAAEEDFESALDIDPDNRIAQNRLREIEELRGVGGGVRAQSSRPLGHHNVYVIELSPSVLQERKFLAANPDRDSEKPCLYVGLTGLIPEERFSNHMVGIKSSRMVKKYGLRLRPDLYEHLNPMPYGKAAQMEKDLAKSLRDKGYAVWMH